MKSIVCLCFRGGVKHGEATWTLPGVIEVKVSSLVDRFGTEFDDQFSTAVSYPPSNHDPVWNYDPGARRAPDPYHSWAL